MTEIRHIDGVTDVRIVNFIPSKRKQRALRESMPEPVLSIDMKGKVELVNPADQVLFSLSKDKIRHQTASVLIGGYNFNCWLDSKHSAPHSAGVVIRSQDFLMDITPIYLEDEETRISTTMLWGR